MPYPREVLNEIKWREGMELSHARVTYVHRGAPDDLRTIEGRDIVRLGRSFMETVDATIPYHRITRIEHMGRLLYDSEEFD